MSQCRTTLPLLKWLVHKWNEAESKRKCLQGNVWQGLRSERRRVAQARGGRVHEWVWAPRHHQDQHGQVQRLCGLFWESWGPVYRSITQEPPNATCLNQPQQGGWGVVCPLPSHLIFRWRNRDLERGRGLSAVTLPWLELRLQSRYQHSLLSPLVTWSKDDQTSTVLYW